MKEALDVTCHKTYEYEFEDSYSESRDMTTFDHDKMSASVNTV